MRFVRPLAELSLGDAPRVGGKTAVLGYLTRRGFPVPAGFAVTAEAFDAWLVHAGPDTARAASTRGAPAAGSCEPALPEVVAAEVRRAFDDLGRPRVAVRSSAIGEDAPTASYAGLLTTYLDVSGADEVVARVRDVFASGHDPRVRDYGRHRVGARAPLRVACLVQRMLAPAASGVLFTAHPLTGSPEVLALSAVTGVGEALVSGRRAGDHLELRRSDASLVSQHLEGDSPVVALETVREIARLGLRLEAELGAPQDVEWAVVDGRVWVLQARPITTSAPAPALEVDAALAAEIERLSQLDPQLVFSNLFTAELMPAPTPATLELLRAMAQPDAGVLTAFHRDLGLGRFRHALRIETICGRCYFELGSLARIIADAGLPIEPRYLRHPPGPEEHVDLDSGWLRLQVGRALCLFPLYAWRAARVVYRAVVLMRTFAERYRSRLLPELEQRVTRDHALDLGALDDDALEAHVAELERWLAGEGRRVWEVGNQTALISLGVLATLTRWLLGDRDGSQASRLVRGAPGNETLEMNRALLQLAATQDPDARRRFLERFGHRAAEELELSEPRWREAPAFVDATIRRLRERPPPGPAAVEEAATPPLPGGRPWGPLARLRRWVLRRAVANARRNAWLRETPKFHYLRRFEQLRRARLEQGRRLHQRGLLERPGDVFFLSGVEVRAPGPGTLGCARERRERRRLLGTLPLPPTLRIADVGRLRSLLAPDAGRELRGLGVSPGRVVGTACVVTSLDEACELPDDAVLVAPRTDPTWTPLFLSVRAVIVEVGSPLSHSAIVAREYGLPAVVNVTAATRRLATGQRVLVDGKAGTVSVLEGA